MKIKSILSYAAIATAITFLASSLGSVDPITSCGLFTATFMALTAICDYAPRRNFAVSIAPKPVALRSSLKRTAFRPAPLAAMVGA